MRSIVALGMVLNVCAYAIGAETFSDEAVARGIDYTVSQGIDQDGCGVAFVDLDNDGDADLITLGRANGQVGIYENDGAGVFVDRSAGCGIAAITRSSGISAADYDDDGDLDLYFSNHATADRLMRNEGGFVFSDVTVSAGLGSPGAGMGSAWGDYDGDGRLDLYLTTRTGASGAMDRNKLYHNEGDGTFVNVGETLGVVDGDSPSLLMTWFDYDRDGDADIYLANDKGVLGPYNNHLYQNQGGTFIDVSAASGTDANLDCMGIAVGDLNRNGFQDLYLTNLAVGNVLLTNLGDGTFQDDTTAAGVVSNIFGWATLFFDYDQDGWLDIFVCNATNSPDRLYHGSATWPLSDVAFLEGVASPANSYCAAVADVDLDGDLDLAVSALNQKIRLYINNRANGRNWVKFNVVGQGANRFGVGTNVDILAGGGWQMREVFCGSNYKSQNELTLHFGVDQALMVDQMLVTWPGGQTRSLSNYSTNQTWTLYPPERLGDADGDGDLDRHDRAAALNCFTGPAEPGNLQPGCELFDADGDGDVDADDLATLYAGIFKSAAPTKLP